MLERRYLLLVLILTTIMENTDGTIIQFLQGSHSFDGVWFGDKHPTEEGLFWWRKHLSEAVNAYDALVEENQRLREAIETLHGWIKSDSVYTLLRYGAKSPSHSGVDDCEDDFNSDLYNLSEELRAKAKNV